jgi:hypothetical protein
MAATRSKTVDARTAKEAEAAQQQFAAVDHRMTQIELGFVALQTSITAGFDKLARSPSRQRGRSRSRTSRSATRTSSAATSRSVVAGAAANPAATSGGPAPSKPSSPSKSPLRSSSPPVPSKTPLKQAHPNPLGPADTAHPAFSRSTFTNLALNAKPAQDDSKHRVSGGQDRLASRVKNFQSTFLNRGDMSKDDCDRLSQVFSQNASQVFPTSFSSRSVLGGAVREDSDMQPPLELQSSGFMPTGSLSSDAGLMAHMYHDFKVKAAAEAKKKKKNFTSLAQWLTAWFKTGSHAPRGLSQDPELYMRLDWHFKCVLFITATYEWPVARKYDELVMEAWLAGALDTTDIFASAAYADGRVDFTLEERCFQRAMASVSLKQATTKAAARKDKQARYPGTKEKVNATDTQCPYHDNKYYPVAANHTAASCFKRPGR